METAPDISERATRWSPRVRAWLITLALVPLLGTAWFALGEIREVLETRRQAGQVATAAEDLIEVTELNARLLDERNWISASAAISELGVPSQFVRGVVGVDIEQELTTTVIEVDRLIEVLDFENLKEQLLAARSFDDKNLLDVGLEYEVIAETVNGRATQSFDEALNTAGDTPDAAKLVNSLLVLDGASQASQAVTIQLTAYYGAQFGGDDAPRQLRTLIGEQARYVAALDSIRRITPVDSRSYEALEAVISSEETREFDQLVQDLIDDPPTATGDVGSVLAALPDVVASFGSGTASVESHLAIVNAAHADIVEVTDDIRAAATATTRDSLIRLAILGAASMIFALGVARAIGRPLRLLADVAEHLRDGRHGTRVKPSGPREVRKAILALNEAAGHIELANRQAMALSIGELDSPVLEERAPGVLGQSLQDTVRTLATSMSEREDLASRLSHEATHDALTGLANRAASVEHLNKVLDEVQGSDKRIAVVFIDLDDFKLVNDHHGHPIGDQVLAIIGTRLRNNAQPGALVGRIGGDEFIVIADDAPTNAEIIACTRSLLDATSMPVTVDGRTVRISASAGIAVVDGSTTTTPDEVLRDADLAVYKAKGRRGTRSIEVCDDALRAEQAHRATIEAALRHALENDDELNELHLHFQPVVETGTGRILSVEALLRWRCERLGRMIGPAEFIPIAERSNLILEIDRLVMAKAAQQLDVWTTHPAFGAVSISVNVSAGHIATSSFVADVMNPLNDHGVDPRRVIIEVTESALLRDLEGAAAKLEHLRTAGIRVAIDDFGSGYTSLGQLRRLPIDVLKIDRSFVADESATGLVDLIINMGHLLGTLVIAEGIETLDEAQRLTILGADAMQGYLFARPAPPAEIEARYLDGSVNWVMPTIA